MLPEVDQQLFWRITMLAVVVELDGRSNRVQLCDGVSPLCDWPCVTSVSLQATSVLLRLK